MLSSTTCNQLYNSLTTTRNSSIVSVIDDIDSYLQCSIDTILHHPQFQQLEASWIGISQQLETIKDNPAVTLKLMQLTKTELYHETQQSRTYEHSKLYNSIYSKEFNTPGGQPYSILIADYSFDASDDDIDILTYLSQIGHAALCPIISAASSQLFNLDNWSAIHQQHSLSQIPQLASHIRWSTLRKHDYSKFIFLTAPAYLGRRIYTKSTNNVQYSHQEHIQHMSHYCWVNSAYAQARCIINAYLQHGWCTAIRGKENGGAIYNLPLTHSLKATQALLTDSQEHELSKLGIIPLCHYKNTNYAVIFASESVHLAAEYDSIDATQNSRISARLPYILATSRFAHYLKIIARDKIGSFMEKDDLEIWLNRWISQYVNSNARSKSLLKARFPLADASITLEDDNDNPGHYHAIIHLKPWLLLEELSASLRLVTKLPKEHH